MRFHARAPTRICFLGGGTDNPLFSADIGGAIVNAAINRYIYVTVEVTNHDINQVSENHTVPGELSPEAASDDRFPLKLLTACNKRLGVRSGLKVAIESSAPPGSGLGTSSALCVSLLAALHGLNGNAIEPAEIAYLAVAVERGDLELAGGIQDQYAAAFGGINFITNRGYRVNLEQAAGRFASQKCIHASTLLELEKNTLLVYTGMSHNSSDIHKEISKSRHNRNVTHAMKELNLVAEKGWNALMNGDLHTFATLMNESWKLRTKIHPWRTNDRLNSIHTIARVNGALGSETCGAGGGGCVVIICKDGSRQNIEDKLSSQGFQVLHFSFDMMGVQVWST